MNASSVSVMETEQSGNFEYERIFSLSFCACSRVSIGVLVRLNYVDLAETRRRASVTHCVDLWRLAFPIAARSVDLPITAIRNQIAGLPKVGGAGLIGHLGQHSRFLAALDFPECVAAELEIVALLIDGVAAASFNQDAVVHTGDQILERRLGLARFERH